jgi:Flp pilus assembly protein TadB
MNEGSEISQSMEAKLAQADQLQKQYDDSTKASWFWAFLFGPIYFAVHGFWGRAAIIFVLNFLVIGIIVAPFMAYPAWRERAEKKAQQSIATAALMR